MNAEHHTFATSRGDIVRELCYGQAEYHQRHGHRERLADWDDELRDRSVIHRRRRGWGTRRYLDWAGCRMAFGMFDGRIVDGVPAWYLSWCLDKLQDLHPYERSVMEQALLYRTAKGALA